MTYKLQDSVTIDCRLDQISERLWIGQSLILVSPNQTEALLGIITRRAYAKLATDFAEHNIKHYSKDPDQRTIDGIAAVREYLDGDLTREELNASLIEMRHAINRFNTINATSNSGDSDPDHIVASAAYNLVFRQSYSSSDLFLSCLDFSPNLRMFEAIRQGEYIIDYLASAEYIFSLGME